MSEFAALSPWFWVVAPVTVIFAYTVFGMTGFGSTVISVPILAHFLPLTFLVPLMSVLDLFAALLLGSANRERVSRDEIKRLVPVMFLGFVIGLTVLVNVPQTFLKVALGVFVAVVGVHGIANPVLRRAISKWWSVPAGLSGGAIATVFGAGGPIYATYLSGRIRDKGEIRATISSLISISAFVRSVIYALGGLLITLPTLLATLALMPAAWAGLKLGGRIHVGLSQEQMRRAIGILLVVTGLSLLLRIIL